MRRRVSYTLTARASVTATVVDVTGTVVATPFAGAAAGRAAADVHLPGGRARGRLVHAGRRRPPAKTAAWAPDGTVRRRPDAHRAGAEPSTLTPNGDGVDDSLGISFTLASPANVVVQIEQAGAVVAPVATGSLPAGAAQLTWDGTTPSGPAPAGTYDAVVLVDGPFGRTRHAVSFTVAR